MKDSMKTIAILCTIGLLAGVGIAMAFSSIWSPSSGPTTATTPPGLPVSLSAVIWADETQPTLNKSPTAIHTGDTLELSTTITPTTTHTQTVTFYFTKIVNPTSANYVSATNTDPAAGLVVAGTATGTSVVSYDWLVPTDGTYYFIAEIVAPT